MTVLAEPRLTRHWDDPGVIGVQGYVAAGGYGALRSALAMAPADIVEVVKASGLRGRGGAGFPTGMKWGFVPTDTGKPTYVVVNFDESEPGTCNNRELVERDPHRLLEGTAIAALAIGCRDRVHLHPRRVPVAVDRAGARDRARRTRAATSVPTCWAPARPSTWSCTAAPAPTSAARRRRC